MSDRGALIALAERVESLEGPDRVTDCDIRMAVLGDMPFGVVTDNRHQIVRSGTLSEYIDAYRDVINLDGAISDEEIRHYTTSIDGALSLVPEGASWSITSALADEPPCATVVTMESTEHGLAESPALALTAAALRARAKTLEKSHD